MGKKIVVVNVGPRKGWNTDILLSEASNGAVSAGADVQRRDHRYGIQDLDEEIER